MSYLDRIDGYRDEMIKVLGETVAFPSVASQAVRNEAGESLPFGKPAHEALLHMLKLGEELGFEAHNVDNYAGYLDFKSEEPGAKQCAIVGHLDVVPEGTGWDNDPYTMTEKDGFLYGRGTADDKGPVVAGLYAMKAIKEEGLHLKNDIRLVLGLNEECGDESMVYYTEHCGHPDMGFTPDGDFPIVNGEKGIMVFDLAKKLAPIASKDELRLTKLEAGLVHNAVPASCTAVIAGGQNQYDSIIQMAKAFTEETGYIVKARKQGSSLQLAAEGVAAHGAHPQLGLNAISIMMKFLAGVRFASDDLADFITFYNDHIGFDLHGERLGIGFSDEASGKLILNVGIANINEELATISINVRYPVHTTDNDVIAGIESTIMDSQIGFVNRMVQGPIYMDLETEMVQKMYSAYVEETGDTESKPIVQAGGTYAKMVNNILCFGAMFPGEEDTMHQANEKFSIDSFMKMTKIYARALYKLCCE